MKSRFLPLVVTTDPRAITLVSDPSNKIPELFMRAFGHLGGEIEATVTGTMIPIDDGTGRDEQIFLEVQSIKLTPGHEP